jgi:hypothetical protein
MANQRTAEELLRCIQSDKGRLVSFVPHKPSLEDLFLKETGEGMRS